MDLLGRGIPILKTFIVVVGFGLASCDAGPAAPEASSQRITLSATVLDFTQEQKDRPLRVTNTQELAIDWFVKSRSATWVTVTPGSGTLESDASQTLTISVDRSRLSEGTNSASIEFEGSGQTIVLAVRVEHFVAEEARASLDPSSLSLGASDASGVLEVVNSGSAPLDWTMTGPEWVTIDPISGQVPGGERRQVVLTPDRSSLSTGRHTATISLTSNGGAPTSSLTVDVGGTGGLRLNPSALDFGKSLQELETQVVNGGSTSIDWSAQPGTSWISLSPSTGSLSAGSSRSVVVQVDREAVKALPYGEHQAAIRFSSNGGSAGVSVKVTNPAPENFPPKIIVSPSLLDFGGDGTELPLHIANEGGELLDWSAETDVDWVHLSTLSGRVPANESQTVKVRVSRSRLSSGAHTASIQFTSNGGSASTAVTLEVTSTTPPPSDDPPSDDPPADDPPSDDPPADDPSSDDKKPTLSSIDATGTTDVSDEMNAYIASVPDGSTITFPAGARYRLENILLIRNRNGLTIEGNGAVIFANTDGSGVEPYDGWKHLWPRARSHVEIVESNNITIRDLAVRGAHPNAGSQSGSYVEALEGQHGFDIIASSNITLVRVTVTDVYGDFIYVSKKGGRWSNNVHISDSHLDRNGRQGIAITAAKDVLIERSYIGEVGRSMVDIEPLSPDWGAHDITFRNNTFGPCRHLWVSSGGGGGNVHGILFESNHVAGRPMSVKVQDTNGTVRRGSHSFINNTSDSQHVGPKPVFIFKSIDGVTVIGNQHAVPARSRDRTPADVLVYTCNSTDIEIHDNDARGFTQGEHFGEANCATDDE